jgi:uncharacterized membrane protein YbhN (UPF0104 family)
VTPEPTPHHIRGSAPADSSTHVRGRRLLSLLAALIAVVVLLPQIGQAHATVDAIKHADWRWVPAIVAASALSYLMAAIALLGASGLHLKLGRTWIVQVASAFTNRVLPAGLGGMATNVRYLEAEGSTRPAAFAAVAANSAAGFLVHVIGILAIAPLLRANRAHLNFWGPDLPDRWPYLFVVIIALTGAGLLRWGRRLYQRVDAPLRDATRALLRTLRNPSSAGLLLFGSAGVTFAYALALTVACRAYGISLSVPVVLAIYLGASAIASVAPTPGGLGAIEATLVAGLAAAGAQAGPAVSAVLTYRLVTYWFPVIPGVVAYRSLRRSGAL